MESMQDSGKVGSGNSSLTQEGEKTANAIPEHNIQRKILLFITFLLSDKNVHNLRRGADYCCFGKSLFSDATSNGEARQEAFFLIYTQTN